MPLVLLLGHFACPGVITKTECSESIPVRTRALVPPVPEKGPCPAFTTRGLTLPWDLEQLGENKVRTCASSSCACTCLHIKISTSTCWVARYRMSTSWPLWSVALLLTTMTVCLCIRETTCGLGRSIRWLLIFLYTGHSDQAPFPLPCTLVSRAHPSWTYLSGQRRPPLIEHAPIECCLGPKSQGCCARYVARYRLLSVLLWLLCMPGTLAAAADARVGPDEHRIGPEAQLLEKPLYTGAKPGVHCHTTPPTIRNSPQHRKRALSRAIKRAEQNEDRSTWYRGRRVHLNTLRAPRQGPPAAPRYISQATGRQTGRLRLMTWNCGGLHGTKYRELLHWLQAEHHAGRTLDVCCLQETSWRQDQEFVTEPCEAGGLTWYAVHSSGKDTAGLLILVRTGLVRSDLIRTNVLAAGRALHLRLLLEVPVDLMCCYQYAWNPQKSTLVTSNKTEALLRQRRGLWRTLDKWVAGVPRRNSCILVGDFNTPARPEPSLVGNGVASLQAAHQQDQSEFQELIKTHRLCLLNTWSRGGAAARTFIPPRSQDGEYGTQIDFIAVRGALNDAEACKARPVNADIVPTSGARHRPLIASVPAPHRPHHAKGQAPSASLRIVKRVMTDPAQVERLQQTILPALEQMQIQDEIDTHLMRGWTRVAKCNTETPYEGADQPLTQQVQHMWLLRSRLRQHNQAMVQWTNRGHAAGRTFKAWHLIIQLQRCTRELKQSCRHRKTLKVSEAVQSSDIHAAAKRFAPKAPRRRLQLRGADGSLQTHEAEFRQITEYFKNLYDGPDCSPPTLTAPPCFTLAEVQQAIHRLQPYKAMPQSSAPAALWKHFAAQTAVILTKQFEMYLYAGVCTLPEHWSISDLVLLPKVGKLLKTPAHLRPIALLTLPAKALAAVIAQRLNWHAAWYLQDTPQYAYVQHRTLAQALERVLSHCSRVRARLQAQKVDVHGRRQGLAASSISGGCMLSLDVSKAYDHVDRGDLRLALLAAQVPESLVQLILLIHFHAALRVRHGGHEKVICTKRGLRQGCSLAPALWAIYSGWLLRRMDLPGTLNVAQANTTYADDMHYQWDIHNGVDLEAAYGAMKHILLSLQRAGLSVSEDKTVIILGIKGSLAQRALPAGPYCFNLKRLL